MIEEQLLEVNKKIKQIEGVLHKRKEKVSEWNLDYKKVIKERHDKVAYLEKSCGSRIIFKDLRPQQYNKKKCQLQKKVAESRVKIRHHYNELKDLDVLTKKKSRIRLLNLESKQNRKLNNYRKSQQLNIKSKQKQKNLGGDHLNLLFCRTMKDYKSSPFKAEKFIQFSQQITINDQNLGSKAMKYFGVGLQTTPLGLALSKQQKKDDFSNKIDKKKISKNQMTKSCFAKKFVGTFNKNQKIFGGIYQPRNIFEDRIRKIIKYHGDFWNQQLEIN